MTRVLFSFLLLSFIAGQTSVLSCFAFTPSRPLVAVGCFDGSACLYDTNSLQLALHILDLSHGVTQVCLSLVSLNNLSFSLSLLVLPSLLLFLSLILSHTHSHLIALNFQLSLLLFLSLLVSDSLSFSFAVAIYIRWNTPGCSLSSLRLASCV